MHASSSQSVSFYVVRTTTTYEGDSNHAQSFREPKLGHGVVVATLNGVFLTQTECCFSKGEKLNGVA